jgi:hypothetical protein
MSTTDNKSSGDALPRTDALKDTGDGKTPAAKTVTSPMSAPLSTSAASPTPPANPVPAASIGELVGMGLYRGASVIVRLARGVLRDQDAPREHVGIVTRVNSQDNVNAAVLVDGDAETPVRFVGSIKRGTADDDERKTVFWEEPFGRVADDSTTSDA